MRARLSLRFQSDWYRNMKRFTAQISREYGPFPAVRDVHGVSFDGALIWFASGDRLNALDPVAGQVMQTFDIPADAGTAFDGKLLYQLADAMIRKVDPVSGVVTGYVPAPGGGEDSGLTWAEGTLWVGQGRGHRIHRIDPETGEILHTVESDRFVTGVTWIDGKLWHGTWQDEVSEIRQIDPQTGEVLASIDMPSGYGVSGLESNGRELFFCGGGGSGRVQAVLRPVDTGIDTNS